MIEAKMDWQLEIDRLGVEAEAAALTKADELFAEFAAEHERQTSGYRFECRRWGDFLTVFVERSANEGWYGEEVGRKISTALNIGSTTDIRLIDGHCFDRRGEVTYCVAMEKDSRSDVAGFRFSHGYKNAAPQAGYHYIVKPNYPYVPKSRKMVNADSSQAQRFESNCYYTTDGEPHPLRPPPPTVNYPRAAEDDAIRFNGIGMTLYAPAGKGRDVYDTIMAEIARGYEPGAPAK